MTCLLLAALIAATGCELVSGLQGLRALRQAISENMLAGGLEQQQASGDLLLQGGGSGGGGGGGSAGKCRLQFNSPCQPFIKFYLYSRGRRKQELDLLEKSPPPGYDPVTNLKVIIHGYSKMDLIDNIVHAYLSRGTDNILVVDWEKLAKKPCYFSAKMNTWQVSRCTAEAVRHLAPRAHLHIVGFSLGAHVAGHTSAFLSKYHRIKVHRITGLDPALPLYATPWDTRKLDSSDAPFVDVIHTDPGIYGKAEPSGHLDFYINGVTIQPGCFNSTNPPLCSHRRATEVFAESIRSSRGFWGVKCPGFFRYISGYCQSSWARSSPSQRALMGENADPKARGIYFVRTRTYPPYALGWT